MAIEKGLYQAPNGIDTEEGTSLEIDIVNPEMVTFDDGSMEVTIIPDAATADSIPFDGNIVELVFLSDELENYNFNTSEFQLNVTDKKITGSFLSNILGFKYIKNEESQDIFKIGKTLIKLNEVKDPSRKRVGLPGQIKGYSLVQFVVNDVIASRNQILKNGGKIHTEPYNIGNLAIIMFIESPDGILFEFGAALVK